MGWTDHACPPAHEHWAPCQGNEPPSLEAFAPGASSQSSQPGTGTTQRQEVTAAEGVDATLFGVPRAFNR